MTDKGCFIRIGTAAEPMSQTMIENLFSRRIRNSISKIVSNRQDLTFEQLRIYYEERKKGLNSNFKKSLELLTEDDKFNYAAYLVADENNISIKVAKYSSLDRVDLVESNEYGLCSLVKATKSVLDKLDIENKTNSIITHKERIDTPLWDRRALREAVINAIVHNDYSFEVSPKFELFPDRLEITSAGTLPETMSKEEFFEGISIPRNKELMRIYRDLELVESLGSGVPRIVRAYGKVCFKFMDNFTRMIFPVSAEVVSTTPQVTPQVEKLLQVVDGEMDRETLQQLLEVSDRKYFREYYLNPAIEGGYIELTIPDKPTSSKQKYRKVIRSKENR